MIAAKALALKGSPNKASKQQIHFYGWKKQEKVTAILMSLHNRKKSWNLRKQH